jgi:D-arabinose 1-dehydrogenase-like Zn-dependent alcohol dehydrogenase
VIVGTGGLGLMPIQLAKAIMDLTDKLAMTALSLQMKPQEPQVKFYNHKFL